MSAAHAELNPVTGAAWWNVGTWPHGRARAPARRLLGATVALLHLAAGWALLQVAVASRVVMDAPPLMVQLLAPSAASPAAPPAAPTVLPRAPVPRPQAQPIPVPAAPEPEPAPAAASGMPPPAQVKPEPVAAAAPAVTPAPAAPAAPPPPAPRRIDATAVSYRVEPPVELPLASRRAGESGVVWLRVVVDTRGLPALVQVQRSSGHARLDEQAVWAMRRARFKPHTENGTPIEVEVIAPIEFLLD